MAFTFLISACLMFAVAQASVVPVAPVVTYSAAPVVATKIVTPSVNAVAATQEHVVRSFSDSVATRAVGPAVAVAAAVAPVAPAIVAKAVPVAYAAPVPAVVGHVVPAATVVKQAIAYSPAIGVSHVSFDGFGTHWAF